VTLTTQNHLIFDISYAFYIFVVSGERLQIWTTNHPFHKRGVARSREPFKFWWASTISLEWLTL